MRTMQEVLVGQRALETHVRRSSKFEGIYFSAQMSSAFQKRVRDAVQSSSERETTMAKLEQAFRGAGVTMHEFHVIEALGLLAVMRRGKALPDVSATLLQSVHARSPSSGSMHLVSRQLQDFTASVFPWLRGQGRRSLPQFESWGIPRTLT